MSPSPSARATRLAHGGKAERRGSRGEGDGSGGDSQHPAQLKLKRREHSRLGTQAERRGVCNATARWQQLWCQAHCTSSGQEPRAAASAGIGRLRGWQESPFKVRAEAVKRVAAVLAAGVVTVLRMPAG